MGKKNKIPGIEIHGPIIWKNRINSLQIVPQKRSALANNERERQKTSSSGLAILVHVANSYLIVCYMWLCPIQDVHLGGMATKNTCVPSNLPKSLLQPHSYSVKQHLSNSRAI